MPGTDVAASRADLLPELVGKLRLVPDDAREFTTSRDFALQNYRLPADLLDQAREDGLPTDLTGRMFDSADLRTLGLHLGVGSISHTLRTFLPRTLKASAGGVNRYRLSYLPRCPDPAHAEPCRYTLRLPEGEYQYTASPQDIAPLHTTTADLPCTQPELPPAAKELMEELAALDLALLPKRARRDTALIRRTGLADCTGLSRLVAEECGRRGIIARTGYGLLLAPPFVNRHYWAEIRAEDRWVPVDPVLLATLGRWGVLDPEQWPAHRHLAGVVWRVSDQFAPLSRHDGVEVPAPFGVEFCS